MLSFDIPCTFQSAAFAIFPAVPESIGQQMRVINLRICACFYIPLLMYNVIQIFQRILSFIGGIRRNGRQGNIMLSHLGIIRIDLPIRLAAVVSCIADTVSITVYLSPIVDYGIRAVVRMLDKSFHLFIRPVYADVDLVSGINVIRCQYADIFNSAVISQRIANRLCCIHAAVKKSRTINRHDVSLAAISGKTHFTDLAGIGAKEKTRIRQQIAVTADTPSFDIDLHSRRFCRFARNNVDDAADSVGAVLGRGGAADDFDAFHIFRSQPLQLIALAAVFGKVAHDGLPVNENERVPRFGAADRNSNAPHGIHSAIHSGFIEDDVFYRFRLLLCYIFLRDDRRALRLVLGRFLRRVRPHLDIARRNAGTLRRPICPVDRQRHPQ